MITLKLAMLGIFTIETNKCFTTRGSWCSHRRTSCQTVSNKALAVSSEVVLHGLCPYFCGLRQRTGGFAAGWFLSSTNLTEMTSSMRFGRRARRETGSLFIPIISEFARGDLPKGIQHNKDRHDLQMFLSLLKLTGALATTVQLYNFYVFLTYVWGSGVFVFLNAVFLSLVADVEICVGD